MESWHSESWVEGRRLQFSPGPMGGGGREEDVIAIADGRGSQGGGWDS